MSVLGIEVRYAVITELMYVNFIMIADDVKAKISRNPSILKRAKGLKKDTEIHIKNPQMSRKAKLHRSHPIFPHFLLLFLLFLCIFFANFYYPVEYFLLYFML